MDVERRETILLNLRLRDEFLGQQTPETAISLRKVSHEPPDSILEKTYPTADIQTAMLALSIARKPKPIVLVGDRGRGKSHITGVMHHAMGSPDVVESWAHGWGQRLGIPLLQNLQLQRGYSPISEQVLNNEYPMLWNLLFDRHPKGQFYKGRFQQSGQPYPPRSLIEDMLKDQPVVLILDELQKWLEGLTDEEGPTGRRWHTWGCIFLQMLSEIACDRPDLLVLVVSVLNNNTEAFRQVHRSSPVIINFQGASAKRDRQLLVLHRIFANRSNIPQADIQSLTVVYAQERFRLRFSHLPATERDRVAEEVVTAWPFSPELIELLEDQVLMAEAAQETRDLIRVLAAVYRVRGDPVPVLTPADFFVDDDSCGVQALLASIATAGSQEELLQIAQRNLDSLRSQGTATPHSREIISALWMRSMSPGRFAGGTRQELHLDITRDAAQDDNGFLDELLRIKDGSVNIHGADDLQGRLWFGPGENAKTKVRSTARNDRLWELGAPAASGTASVYPGKDIDHIRNTLRHILVPETRQPVSRVVVLGPQWQTDPWTFLDVADQPAAWNQPILLVIPSVLDGAPGNIDQVLGKWLATQVPAKRNTVRFLLPVAGSKGIYDDRDLIFSARCSYLTSQAWKDDPQYRSLKDDFDRPLRDTLRTRFDRFAVLATWNFRQPDQCRFDVERIDSQLVREKGAIPLAVDEQIKRDLFDPATFQSLAIEYAKTNQEVSKLVDGLKEPPPSTTTDAIPYLGETAICEEIMKVAAKGKIVLNVAGAWVSRLPEHTDDEDALRYIRPRAFRSAQEMRQVQMALPSAAGSSAMPGAAPPLPPVIPTTPPPLTPTGGLFPPGIAPVPVAGAPAAEPPTFPPGEPPTTLVPAELQTYRSPAPASGINLSGSFEQWGVPAEATMEVARLEFAGLSVQQIKQLLQRLPSNLRATLEVSYRKNGQT